jgi:hypothetical protein
MGDGDEVRNLSSSGVARWLTLGSYSLTQGSLSFSMLAFSLAAPDE